MPRPGAGWTAPKPAETDAGRLITQPPAGRQASVRADQTRPGQGSIAGTCGDAGGGIMIVTEYIVLFVLVAILGAGLPGPGDASLIAAGTLAGEGKLNVGIVLATAMAAWMLGSVAGYEIGVRGGRPMLDHPGRLEKRRRNLLAKGDRAFGRHTFLASATMPAFVSGIFRVRFWLFMLGALVAGIGWIGMYVGLSYFLGEEVAKRIGNAGAKALLGVLVIVAIGLALRFGYARWRATRQAGRHEQDAPKDHAPLTGDPP